MLSKTGRQVCSIGFSLLGSNCSIISDISMALSEVSQGTNMVPTVGDGECDG